MQPIKRFFCIIGLCISRKIYSIALFIECCQMILPSNFLFTYIVTTPPWLTRSERYTLYPSHDISTSRRLWTKQVSDTHIRSISEFTNKYQDSSIFFGRLWAFIWQILRPGPCFARMHRTRMTIFCWIVQVFFHCE